MQPHSDQAKAQRKHSGAHQEHQLGSPGGNTTNLTLNMNFNLQQSTIQMQPVGAPLGNDPSGGVVPGHQRIYHSPRQYAPPEGHPSQLSMIHMSPQQHAAAVSASKKQHHIHVTATPQNKKSNQLAASGQEAVQASGGRGSKFLPGHSSPPMHPSTSVGSVGAGKVKKMKLNKLNSEQLNQIRLHQQENVAQHLAPNASSVKNSSSSQQHRQFHVHVSGTEQARQGSIGNNHHHALQGNAAARTYLSPDANQMHHVHPKQFYQAANVVLNGSNMQYSLASPNGNSVANTTAGLTYVSSAHAAHAAQQLPLKGSHVQRLQQEVVTAGHHPVASLKSQSVSNMSHRNENLRDQQRLSSCGVEGHGGAGSRLCNDDSKLARKGERPTVAQILEIGVSHNSDQNWIDADESSLLGQAHKQVNNTHNQTQNNFITISGNIGTLPGQSHTQKSTKKMKEALIFEDARMTSEKQSAEKGLVTSSSSHHQKQLGSTTQFQKNSGLRNSRNTLEDNLYSRHQDGTTRRKKLESPQGMNPANIKQSRPTRNIQAKLLYSEGARIHAPPSQQQQQPQQQYAMHHQQQQPQMNFMPMLVDLNSGSARPTGQNAQSSQQQNQQLFSRLQQQFLEQSAVIRHAQMGELPVISMTQQQLNNMIQQAALHRQNAQYLTNQHQNQSQQAHPGQFNNSNKGNGSSALGQGASSSEAPSSQGHYQFVGQMPHGGNPQQQPQPQMAFAIQIQDPVSQPVSRNNGEGAQTQIRRNRTKQQSVQHAASMPLDPNAFNGGHLQQQSNLFFPSLRMQNHMLPSHQHTTSPQSQTVPTLQSPLGAGVNAFNGNLIMSQAPIKKMTLQSRGKSVPRSSARGDAENNGQQLAMDAQHALMLQQQANYKAMMGHDQQQQNFQPSQNQARGVPMGNLTAQQFMQQAPDRMGQSHQQQSYQPLNSRGTSHQDIEGSNLLLVPQMESKGGARNSMSIRVGSGIESNASANRSNGNVSMQSRRQAAAKYASNYIDGGKSQRGTSRNLASQSDRSSQRTATQGGNIIVGATQVSTLHNVAYMAQKGPLSDLIMTQQSNLNVNQQRGSALRKAKQNKSSITVASSGRHQGPETGTHEVHESSHDINGGVPYIFENQKISQAIGMDDFNSLHKGTIEVDPAHLSSMLAEFENSKAHGNESQPEPKKTKKAKGRKGVNTSQRDKNLLSQSTKGSVDQVRFGQRQFSQQQPHIPGMIQNMVAQSQNQANASSGIPPRGDKKKKQPPSAQQMTQQFAKQLAAAQAHPEMQDQAQLQAVHQYQQQLGHPDQHLLESQHQLVTQSTQGTVVSGGTATVPANLKPNIQLKRSPTKKVSDSGRQINAVSGVAAAVEVAPGQEASLGQHGMFAKGLVPACTKYYKSKNNSRMTPCKYRNGISTRLLVGRETFSPKRAKLPILVLNIDGALGYFDEQKHYICKEKVIQTLQSLSHNFKIVGFSCESKGLITRFGKQLSEFKLPFAFDAVYQVQRKPTQNQNRVNLTHVILDFSGEDEEDLDLFVSSQMVLLTVDKQNLCEKFESMDLREVFDFDKEYLKGAKAPLILRLPHARTRGPGSVAFEVAFQMLTGLLVCSKLGNMETTSFFTYNERTKGICIPSSDKGILTFLMPEKMKLVDKSIQTSKSLRFIMGEPQHGLNFHKGFKMLTEVYKGCFKPDWLDFNYRIYKPLLPIRMRLQKITQIALQGAQPPTGKKLIVRCETEEATRKYQIFVKKNEIVRKHIRKYRARYWAVNQIEDPNLDEENQDIVGDLLDTNLPKSPIDNVIPEEPTSPAIIVEEPCSPEKTPGKGAEAGVGAAEGQDEKGQKLAGGACSSSSEDSDSDNEHYDEKAQAIKFKMIDIKQVDGEGPVLKRQTTTKLTDPHKLVKIECRKLQKPRHQFLLDFCSKKQNAMMFTTNQQQHLLGAQALQIEQNITELNAKLNEQEKTGKKEVCNYDF